MLKQTFMLHKWINVSYKKNLVACPIPHSPPYQTWSTDSFIQLSFCAMNTEHGGQSAAIFLVVKYTAGKNWYHQ